MRAALKIALLLCAIGVAAFPAPANAVSDEFFGAVGRIEVDGVDYDQMEAAHVGMYRFALGWRSVQPTVGGPFHWTAYDRLIADLAARGIRPLPMVWGGDREATNTRPHRAAWRKFMIALVKRYGDRGRFWRAGPGSTLSPYQGICRCNAKPKPVKAWQIWNEPNLRKYLPRHMRSPRQYAKLVKISDRAIDRTDPRARTVLAGLAGAATVRKDPSPGSSTPWEFLRSLYRVKGVKRAFDAAALDPYGPRMEDLRMMSRRTRKTMSKHRDRKTALWITEIGWGSANPAGHSSLNRGLKGQKRMLDKSFRLFLRRRHEWKIQRVLWYMWRDPLTDQGICSFCGSAGLLRHDRSQKPAYDAFVKFTGGS